MELIKGDGKLLEDIDLAPANVYQEVVQNIAVILASVKKASPMLRDVGIAGNLYGRPLPVVENILIGEIYDQIEEYEPRAILEGVTFEQDAFTGELTPIVKLEGVRENGDE